MAKDKTPKLNIDQAGELLAGVFEKCDVAENTIPVKELKSYSNFRKGSYILQQTIIIIAFWLVFFVPVLFIVPRVNITVTELGERGFPVYYVDVLTLLPVESVVATVGTQHLPVYAVDSHLYTVEPVRDGSMTITVTLFNGQSRSEIFSVSSSDKEAPVYLGMKEDGDTVYFYFSDEGSGINYLNTYMIEAGDEDNRIEPSYVDMDLGCVGFTFSESEAEIVVSDKVGNNRRLTIKR